MASADGELFKDTFVVDSVDMHEVENASGETVKVKDKKFDKVSRIDASSENYATTLTLDVNMELYPLRDGDRLEMLLATQLGETGGDDYGAPGYDPTRKLPSRADAYDYIMYGKIFKYAESEGKAVVYVSFGGLLMALKGEPRTLGARAFNVDSTMYLFLRKIQDML